jgi:hypothetical protein
MEARDSLRELSPKSDILVHCVDQDVSDACLSRSSESGTKNPIKLGFLTCYQPTGLDRKEIGLFFFCMAWEVEVRSLNSEGLGAFSSNLPSDQMAILQERPLVARACSPADCPCSRIDLAQYNFKKNKTMAKKFTQRESLFNHGVCFSKLASHSWMRMRHAF